MLCLLISWIVRIVEWLWIAMTTVTAEQGIVFSVSMGWVVGGTWLLVGGGHECDTLQHKLHDGTHILHTHSDT